MNIMKRKLISLAAAIAIAATALADNVTTPYSMYGYGVLNDRATSMQRQMGGVGVAMNSGRQVNVMNPASYAAIDSLTFLWDMGADVSMLWQKEGSAKEFSTGGGLDYITMQFPIWKYMGASVGLVPLSQVGYSFGSDIYHGTRQNQGSGGINEAYLGFAGSYKGFNLGFNVSYDFGNIINDIYNYPTTTGTSLFEHVMQIRDWNILLGAQYTAQIARDHKLTLGVTYQPKKTMLGKTYCTLQETSKDAVADTITNGVLKMKNLYYQPQSVGAGINYTVDKKFHFSVEADVQWQQWSKAKYSELTDRKGQVIFQGMNFSDRWRYSLGAEFVPAVRGNYGQRMTYRLGGYATRDYVVIDSNHIREYGVSCGLGLPVLEGKTLINIGFEWKKREATPQKLISENYFNITFGVNFNEVWFWQRKIR